MNEQQQPNLNWMQVSHYPGRRYVFLIVRATGQNTSPTSGKPLGTTDAVVEDGWGWMNERRDPRLPHF
jgi:hypothetical protein